MTKKSKKDELVKIREQNKKLRKQIKELKQQLEEARKNYPKIDWPSVNGPSWLG
ncbi:MAG: hypothetical protein PHW73_04125 [Atribacterota bacterium]|nr:hypothetical protein [Atribacterota bacterium]